MYGYGYSPFSRVVSSSGGTPVDPDAQAFITAAAITNPTQQSAINQLVTDLKGYGIWTKMKALYPFVGGTASSHKFNLKNPLDTDAAFRLVFNGGWTHSANGALPNGTNGYADTKIGLNTLLRDSNSTGIYSRTDLSSGADYGVFNTGGNGALQLNSKDTGFWYIRNASTTLNSVLNTDSRGFFQMTRRNSSSYVVSKNTSKSTINTSSTDTIPWNNTATIPIGALSYGSIIAYSARQYAFMYVGNISLNDIELDNLYALVNFLY